MTGPQVAPRAVHGSGLPVFHRQSNDPEALWTAAFTAGDPAGREAFEDHRARIRTAPDVVARTVLCDGDVVGHAAVHGTAGEREVTYRTDRAYWGRGIATAALRALPAEVTGRPLHARVAADDAGSLRVLEKCGFRVVARETGYAPARGAGTDELVLAVIPAG
ncbi:GNAT family N-acetyltransferase [Streptomyces sp. QTS137]